MTDDLHRIALVEDETPFARAVAKVLRKSGYQCSAYENLADGLAGIVETQPDLLLLDMRLPDGSGLDFLGELRERDIAVPVIVLTAFGDLENAVAAMKLGAVDYLKKPVDMDDLARAIKRVLDNVQLNRKLDYSRTRETAEPPAEDIPGDSPAMQRVREQIAHISNISARTAEAPPTVLILGETGCGKDLVARALHRASRRGDRPFVHVDCAALPDELIEAELFGHEKGAFTSAHKQRSGLIEAAEDGTVFLDEIGELPLDLQPKLLSVLERRRLRSVGSTRERSTEAWFIAATNRDLDAMVERGEFRSDLYFRLNIMQIKIPPLRERGEDIVQLAMHFLQQSAVRYGVDTPDLPGELLQALRRYHWPGNVRELAHMMERAALLSQGGSLSLEQLGIASAPGARPPAPELTTMTLEEAEVTLIKNALERTKGNVSQAARELGVTRMTLRHRIQKYAIK